MTKIQSSSGERLLSPQGIADQLSISRWTVYYWISSGKIASVKVGGRLVRVPQSEVDRIIRQGSREGIER